jgi:alcohol dehydrogenase class IV
VDGIRRAASALPRVCRNGGDLAARTDMAWASLLGGLALANAGLGAAHGFAAPLGGMFPVPHGAACAAVLPHVMAVNVAALRRRQPDGEGLRRYSEIARLLSGRPRAAAEEGVDFVAALCRRLEVPPLRSYGVSEADVPDLVEKAAHASSMKANPIVLTEEELSEIAMRAI